MYSKKISVLACLITLAFGTTQAQQKRTCSSMENQARLEKMYPELVKNQLAIEEQTSNYLMTNAKTEAVIVNIPVVVHVLYNTASQNISDAQVTSQIDVLNEDFRKLNADKGNVPSAFASLAADCNITFCLAKKDPNGNATTGIIHKYTTATSFIDDDQVKSSTTGGDNAWNTGKYLNLWVCNLGNGLLGYAQFPGGPVSTDGVVILYSAFGRTGTVSAPYNKGRTATHEVGHWLNLRHIWGDANCGSDLVNDTPTQQTSNYGCPSYPHVTCSNSGDMSMNYMDYVDDACMYMFSAGQSARMNALFASGGARASILTSTACGSSTTSTTTSTTTSSSMLTIGTGTASSGAVPYGTYYMDERAQLIVTKAELVSAGFTSTNKYIKALAFNVATANAQTMANFTIKISHITSSAFSSTSFLSGTNQTTVYNSNFATTSNMWNTHTFSTPFVYNGIDNILIDICWDNSAYNNNTVVRASATTDYMTLYKRSDITTGGLCSTTIGTNSYTRPNMRFTMSSSGLVSASSTSARLADDGITTPKELQTMLYPNPVNDKLSLVYNVFEENANATIDIFNLYGSKVKNYELQNSSIGENNFEINFANDYDLQGLKDGIYFVSLSVNGEKIVKKIILQR
ncbi:MAG: T9SS type A sorting domain-containing protein [Bacteroidetes bacterium]|nr:T9SS type A sorting domain-containing protein [Bacteroidota bacterium]